MDNLTSISATLNGKPLHAVVRTRQHLADFLRIDLGLTGTHLGCEHGVCGACSVVLDGDVVRGCLILAVQIDGREVDTIEGLSDAGALAELQAAFLKHNAGQCGFCTPGMLLTARELLSRSASPSREDIRDYISGNFCRCTGYQAIVDAIEDLARREELVDAPTR
jgi:carbon-monoxide dehydrogenase small subunit